MRSLAVGRVEESRSSDFHPGEYVTGMFGWQDYAVVDAAAIEREVGGSGLPISTSLGVLGLNGLTAYNDGAYDLVGAGSVERCGVANPRVTLKGV